MANNGLIGLAQAQPPDSTRVESCENCKAGCFEHAGDVGHCRAEYPKMQFIPMQNRLGGTELTAQAGWPPVQRSNWCLKFQPKVH